MVSGFTRIDQLTFIWGIALANISMEFLTSSLSCWDRESTFYTGVYENKEYPSGILTHFLYDSLIVLISILVS